jgi:hypothetical protein
LFFPYPGDLVVLLPLEVLERRDFLVGKRVFIQSYNETSTFLLAWGPAVVPVGTSGCPSEDRIGDSGSNVSLSNQGGPIESSRNKTSLNKENVIHRSMDCVLLVLSISLQT